MSRLFSPLSLRGVEFKNRVFVSPMCQYSSQDGLPTDWHFVHLGSRAVGGAALVLVEATAVSPEGRISPWDSGLWSDAHAEAFTRITRFVAEQGAVPGVQLAHAGRKASTDVPWRGGGGVDDAHGGWQPVAPGNDAFSDTTRTPRALAAGDLERIQGEFVAAAKRALAAGFQVIEIHTAHGYLLHEFLSPLVNRRKDELGGSAENRMRFPLSVVRAVRDAWPERLPLFVRISASDWAPGGWDVEASIALARELKGIGVDLVDCSSGGAVSGVRINAHPGYQVPFAQAVRERAGIATGAVGLITEPVQAEQIVATGQADAVLLARELLRNPYWPLAAAHELGADVKWPPQYLRAKR